MIPSHKSADSLHSKRGSRESFSRLLTWIFFWLFVLYTIVPIWWIVAAATKNNAEIFSTFGFFFGEPANILDNWNRLITYKDGIVLQWLGNSIGYSVTIALLSTLLSTAGAYAFAKRRFPGQKLFYTIILGTIMIPSTALVLPLFLTMNRFGILNTPWAFIFPSIVNPYGLYLMRVLWEQSFPDELAEAARIDGAGELRIFAQIGLPLVPNGLITVGLLSFVGAWNNFFLPLLVLSREDLLPLTVGMAVWNQSSVMTGGQPVYTVIAMGSILSILPLLLAFLLFGRYWQSGLAAGGVK
jgi:multiple sugar transport system permease protein